MEMKVDAALIRSEREKRAWSQEHLAKASGLGVRTVQRIEKTGLASYESARALASVFSMNVSELQDSNGRHLAKSAPARSVFVGIAAIAIAASGLLLGNQSVADQIMLDVDASRTDEDNHAEIREFGRLLIADGKVAEMRIDEVLRILVTPELQQDGRVRLSARIFEYLDGGYVLLAEPELITANEKEAEIRIASDSGRVFRFLITPEVN